MRQVDYAVTACVLSYNSKGSLASTIDAVLRQSLPPAKLIIVDNRSTDGTQDLMASLVARQSHTTRIQGVPLRTNLGVGAGHAVGWSLALVDPQCQFVWALEHDCVPFADCLERLLASARTGSEEFSAVATRLSRNLEEHERDRTMPTPNVGAGVTFNSTLLSRSAIERCGVPRTDLFCAGEDWEYTNALRVGGVALRVADAWALHGTKGDVRYGIRPSPMRAYYSIRNDMRLAFEQRGLRAISHIFSRAVGGSILALRRDRPLRAHLTARWLATFDALLGRLGERHYAFIERSHREEATGERRDDQT